MKQLLLVLLLLCLGVGQAWAEPAENLAEAVKLIQAKKNEEAKPLLESILADAEATAVQKAGAYYLFGIIEANPEQAVAFFRQAVAVDPTLERAHVRLVEVLLGEQRYAEAASAAAAGLETFPANNRLNLMQAQALSGAGKYSEAIAVFSKLLDASKREGTLYLQRGRAYQLANLPERAKEDFKSADRLRQSLGKADMGDLLYYVGMLMQDANEFDNAIDTYKKALALQPSVERRADLDKRINDTLGKKKIYKETAAYRKELDRAWESITRRNNPQAALSPLLKIVNVPDLPDDLKARAYLYLSYTGNSLPQRLVYARKAVELGPTQLLAQDRVGHLLFQNKQYDESLQYYTTARALEPGNAHMPLWCGKNRLELGKIDEAIQDFTQALQIDPEFSAAYAARAGAYLEVGKENEALQDLKSFEKYRQNRDASSQSVVQYVTGRLLENKKEYDGALNNYRSAISNDLNLAHRYIADARRRAKILEELKAWSE